MHLLLRFLNRLLFPAGLHLGRAPVRNSLERLLQDLFAAFDFNCVLDVGAHHGEYRELLRALGYGGNIISFEPVSSSFAILSGAAAGDSMWKGCPYGLSDHDR